MRRWVLGEKNLAPQSILDTFYTTKFSSPNKIRLEMAFEEWDRYLDFGVSFYLLFEIFKEMGFEFDEKEQEKFFETSGYYREVGFGLEIDQPAELLPELPELFQNAGDKTS